MVRTSVNALTGRRLRWLLSPASLSLPVRLAATSALGVLGVLLAGALIGHRFSPVALGAQCSLSAIVAISVMAMARRHHRALELLSQAVRAAGAGDLLTAIPATGEADADSLGAEVDVLRGTLADALAAVAAGARALADRADVLNAIAATMGTASESAADQATALATATDRIASSVHQVATAAEEFTATIGDVATHAAEASDVAQGATTQALAAHAAMQHLGVASEEVTQVVDLISRIARQSHLLALNATLEAARAGEAGRAFAMVASEVKGLAEQTAAATGNVSSIVQSMQGGVTGAQAAINDITVTISRVSDNQTAIAGAVEEQTATTSEISRGASTAAGGASDIARNIETLADLAIATAYAGAESRSVAAEVGRLGATFEALAGRYRVEASQLDAGLVRRQIVTTPQVDSGVTRIEDTVTGAGIHEFEYIGEWCQSAGNLEADGTNTYSCKPGDSAVLRFFGSAIKFYGVTDANHGLAGLQLDGGEEVVVDEYSSTRYAEVMLWQAEGLARAEHTLRIRVIGDRNPQSRFTWVTVDRVDVIG